MGARPSASYGRAMTRIVVGIDGSAGGVSALRWAADEARVRGATLVLVHAWHYPYVGGTEFVPVVTLEQVEADARLVLAKVVKQEADALAGVLVEEKLVHGDAGAALVVASRDADLVVVGSRGRGGFKGLLLGSVSQHVAHRSACPVVIVRQEA